MTVLLALWATPRSTSTAFEWMMRQRGDFTCFHEPWNECYYYGEDRQSDRDAHVVPKAGHSYASVWTDLMAAQASANVFVKDFVYSLEHDLDDQKLDAMTHTFLIRDPMRVVQGMARHWPDCTWDEIGFASLHRLFFRLAERTGRPPVVVRSQDLLDQPEGTVRAYCSAIGIDYRPEALEWEAGDRREVSWYGEGTGPWHDNLRASTGIQPPTTAYPPLEDNPRLFEMYERCLPLFAEVSQHALSPTPDPTTKTDAPGGNS